jgi:hypothetical protein
MGNPPGPYGGQGTNQNNQSYRKTNPPGSVGGPGAGPRWKDNPYKTDNPPGPYGGRGTDWPRQNQDVNEAGQNPADYVDNSAGYDETDSSESDVSESEVEEESSEGSGRHRKPGKLLKKLKMLRAQRDKIDQQIAKIESFVSQHQGQAGNEAV